MAFDIDTDRLRLAMECISKGVECKICFKMFHITVKTLNRLYSSRKSHKTLQIFNINYLYLFNICTLNVVCI